PAPHPNSLKPRMSLRKNDVEHHPNAHKRFQPKQGRPRMEQVDEGDVSRKSFKRLHRWRYSATAAYGNNEVHLHPTEVRRLSVAEALAVQSMPQDFELPEDMTLSDMFKTVGNGVPFLMARGIARSVKRQLIVLRPLTAPTEAEVQNSASPPLPPQDARRSRAAAPGDLAPLLTSR
ncbi:DNA cytosine methyltransferase, partial [Deinococcus sp. MIMF12]